MGTLPGGILNTTADRMTWAVRYRDARAAAGASEGLSTGANSDLARLFDPVAVSSPGGHMTYALASAGWLGRFFSGSPHSAS